VWGQERSSTSKWRRHGSRTDERTCTLLEIVGDLVEVEEIGICASSPHPPRTHKKRQENGQEKQGYQQENKSIIVIAVITSSRQSTNSLFFSPLSSIYPF